MTAVFPTKTDYVDGEVFSADDINSTNGTINYIDPTSATDGQVLTRDAASPGQVKWDTLTVAESLGFTAGKNKIINGDFNVNQRAFTSTTVDSTYTFDRWITNYNGGTSTLSAQTFTPGSAPVAGYESTNFIQLASTGQSGTSDRTSFRQRIEGVRTFANQTVTISFWAKASSGTPPVAVSLQQLFGSGGSTAVNTAMGKLTTSTSWQRYSLTVAVPSISGKTIGSGNYLGVDFWISAGSDFDARTTTLGLQTSTIDFWGVQLEAGSVATAFQTATGTIQGELAACQRYYYLHASGNSLSIGNAGYYSATQVNGMVQFPVSMRIAPSLVATTGTDYYQADRNSGNDTFNSFTIYRPTNTTAMIYNGSQASGTAGHAALLYTNNASASVAFSAEL
jgi:hypothetical protein